MGRLGRFTFLDICDMIGSNVVSGGVAEDRLVIFISMLKIMNHCLRNTESTGSGQQSTLRNTKKVRAQMVKMGMPIPEWFDDFSKGKNIARHGIDHRRLSNNSIGFTSKPSNDFLELLFLMIQLDGEPGFINLEEAGRRRPNMQGVNP